MDSLIIVPTKELYELQKRALAWRVGWIFGLFMAAVTALCMYSDHKLVERYNKMQQELKELQEKQKEVTQGLNRNTEALAQAWGEQRKGIDLIVGWAQYIQDRDTLSKHNGRSEPKLIPAMAVTLGGNHGK